MSTTTQKYIVFNYVTSSMEQSEVAPNYGDPNTAIQASLTQAYTGSTVGASSLSSAVPTAPTVATLADPAAQAMAVAESSLSVSPAQLTQIEQSLNSLQQVGQIPATITNMSAHATNVLENGASIFRAIDLTFQPTQRNTENRCNSLSGFIGSVQGAFNDVLKGVTSTLGSVTNALMAIPQAIIGTFTGAMTALMAAIKSGASQLINGAISALGKASSALFGGLGSAVTGLIKGVGAAITGVASAIKAEIENVAGALANVANNPFRLVVPNVNPCLKSIMGDSNSTNFQLPPSLTEPALAQAGTGAPDNLSFRDRLFVQFGIADNGLGPSGADILASQQARANALGISREQLATAEARAYAAGR